MREKKKYTTEEVINYNTLKESVEICKKGKMWKESMIQAEIYSDYLIHEILSQLKEKNTLYFSDLNHFQINERGKIREICSLKPRDRIIQKAINKNFLLPAFSSSLIYDNHASLKGHGMDKAYKRMECFMKKAYRKYGNNFYFLKCDIKNYFDSIPHDYCINLIKQHTDDETLISIINNILKKYKYDRVIHGGDKENIGLGLGGEVSQTFGIIALNEIDHYIKEQLKIPYYIRYMDDFILFHPDKDYLNYCKEEIIKKLNKIGLMLNQKKTQIIKAKNGVVFLKMHYYLSSTGKLYIKAENKSLQREKRKLRKLKEKLERDEITFREIYQSYQSFRDHLKYTKSQKIQKDFDKYFNDMFIRDFLKESPEPNI